MEAKVLVWYKGHKYNFFNKIIKEHSGKKKKKKKKPLDNNVARKKIYGKKKLPLENFVLFGNKAKIMLWRFAPKIALFSKPKNTI